MPKPNRTSAEGSGTTAPEASLVNAIWPGPRVAVRSCPGISSNGKNHPPLILVKSLRSSQILFNVGVCNIFPSKVTSKEKDCPGFEAFVALTSNKANCPGCASSVRPAVLPSSTIEADAPPVAWRSVLTSKTVAAPCVQDSSPAARAKDVISLLTDASSFAPAALMPTTTGVATKVPTLKVVSLHARACNVVHRLCLYVSRLGSITVSYERCSCSPECSLYIPYIF